MAQFNAGSFRAFGAAAVVLSACGSTRSGAGQAPQFVRRELSIPVRDGVHLFAVVLVPRNDTAALPVLLIRTPFNASQEFATATLPLAYRALARDGYIFVVEDIRGRYRSGGTFVTNRPLHDPRGSAGTDESTDAYDTIDWLVKHLPHTNGRVGVLGVSYRGWLAAMAGVHPHPALKAISPQAPTADTWMGDDFFHHGAFRETQAVEYTAWIEGGHAPSIPTGDQYEFYLRQGTLRAIAAATGVAGLPSWGGFVEHPAFDPYWQARAMEKVLTNTAVPTLFVGGFWDAEDLYGSQIGYRTMEQDDTAHRNRIVLGPWTHGEWAQSRGDSVGPMALGSMSAEYFRDSIERPWFAYYLHGEGDGRFPEAWVYETGENQWHTFDTWPPRGAAPRSIYLRAGGMLSFDPSGSATRARPNPAANGAHTAEFDAFRSDPAHPVPYVPRPDDESGWSTWMEEDQRFVAADPGVLTWASAPLDSDITITGDVVAHLYASTTGADADWIVKLIDVFPDRGSGTASNGYELMVNGDIMRGRYWKSFSSGTPIPANAVTRFDIDLHDQLYRFRRGHRIMVQVQSSWFALYDRNPQSWVANIFSATPKDFQAEEHRIWHTVLYPSHLSVETLP